MYIPVSRILTTYMSLLRIHYFVVHVSLRNLAHYSFVLLVCNDVWLELGKCEGRRLYTLVSDTGLEPD